MAAAVALTFSLVVGLLPNELDNGFEFTFAFICVFPEVFDVGEGRDTDEDDEFVIDDDTDEDDEDEFLEYGLCLTEFDLLDWWWWWWWCPDAAAAAAWYAELAAAA